MAQIVEEKVIITVSRIVRAKDTAEPYAFPDDFETTVEQVVADLIADPNVVVEVTIQE